MKKGFVIVWLIAALWGTNAWALALNYDLNSGSFVTLPATGSQATDYTGIYQSNSLSISESVLPASTFFLTIDFLPGQSLTVSDDAASVPQEGVLFDVFGTGSSNINAIIRLRGATGEYQFPSGTFTPVTDAEVFAHFGPVEQAFNDGARIGSFSAAFPNDPAVFPGDFDVTNSSLSFTGVELEIFNSGLGSTISLDTATFFAVGNTVTRVPAPGPTALLGLGFLGLGNVENSSGA